MQNLLFKIKRDYRAVLYLLCMAGALAGYFLLALPLSLVMGLCLAFAMWSALAADNSGKIVLRLDGLVRPFDAPSIVISSIVGLDLPIRNSELTSIYKESSFAAMMKSLRWRPRILCVHRAIVTRHHSVNMAG